MRLCWHGSSHRTEPARSGARVRSATMERAVPEAPAQADLEPPQEVRVPPISPERLREVLDPADWREFEKNIARANHVFEGHVIWMVSSTAAGGGVAEMLRSFLAYTRGVGVNVRWLVMTGTPEFFQITKRLHNLLHGSRGDGGDLGEAEWRVYEAVCVANAEHLAALVRPSDIVLLHDPQTAGMVPRLKQTGAPVVWRSHIGAERPNELVHKAWRFLEESLRPADACVFSRHAYVPEWANAVRTEIIQPSIDAFSPKNQELDDHTVQGVLTHVGLAVDGTDAPPVYTRQDGTPGRVDRLCEVLSTGPPPRLEDPLVVQVSRWDRLKDPVGVMLGFAEHVAPAADAHLILAGPTVHSVADDPEGADVLDEVVTAWQGLSHARRSRVHLSCLPMADIEENATIVNALQRHATVVVQKSLQEGFGLTVAEAMWKSRPVVASAVGGIQDQIEDGVTGFLLEDPTDLDVFGQRVLRLLRNPELAAEIGARAREHVRRNFLANRHALQYIELFASIFERREGR
jgi:trehalose synthase